MPDTSNAIGKLAEVIVLKQLVKAGYQVALPFGNQAHWDILIQEQGIWRSAQIKAAGYRQRKNLSALVVRTRGRKKRTVLAYQSSDVDYIIIADVETECIWRYKTPVEGLIVRPQLQDIWLRGHVEPVYIAKKKGQTGFSCHSRRKAALLFTERPHWLQDRGWVALQALAEGKSYAQIGALLGIRLDSASDFIGRLIKKQERFLSHPSPL